MNTCNIKEMLNEIDSMTLGVDEKVELVYELFAFEELYEDAIICLRYIADLTQKNGCECEYARTLQHILDYCGEDALTSEEKTYLEDIRVNLASLQQEYLNTDNDIDIIRRLADLSYCVNEILYHIVATELYNKVSNSDKQISYYAKGCLNIGYFIETLEKDQGVITIILDGYEDPLIDYDVLSNMLFRLNHKVVLMVRAETDNLICTQASAMRYSIENRQEYEDVIYIPFVENEMYDNSKDVLSYVCKEYADNHFCIVISNGKRLDAVDLLHTPSDEFEFGRLSAWKADAMEDKLAFGWGGSYISLISILHKRDVIEDIEAEPEYDFSIVIPARNTAESLKYTVMTCLNQRYKGKFEIVICDNSDEGNDEVQELIQAIGSPKIHYFRSERNYLISRSFENAILHSRGNFIIPIGSDDALFPWTLDVLSEICNEHDDEIIMWDRGMYQWPDFGQGIADRIAIAAYYSKGNYPVVERKCKDFIQEILQNHKNMYGLPLLYISSGFKRSYLNTLLNKTGRLWDGSCQDIYMGMINIGLHDKILHIGYPLSIAGMTGKSTGVIENGAWKSIEAFRNRICDQKKINYIGGRDRSIIERLVPPFNSDASTCYNCFLRSVARHALPMEILQTIDWKQWIQNLLKSVKKDDITYGKKMKQLLFSAKIHGVQEWFKVYAVREYELKANNDEQYLDSNQKNYTEKLSELQMIVDGSKHNVSNIYEVVTLIEYVLDL